MKKCIILLEDDILNKSVFPFGDSGDSSDTTESDFGSDDSSSGDDEDTTEEENGNIPDDDNQDEEAASGEDENQNNTSASGEEDDQSGYSDTEDDDDSGGGGGKDGDDSSDSDDNQDSLRGSSVVEDVPTGVGVSGTGMTTPSGCVTPSSPSSVPTPYPDLDTVSNSLSTTDSVDLTAGLSVDIGTDLQNCAVGDSIISVSTGDDPAISEGISSQTSQNTDFESIVADIDYTIKF